MPSWRAVLEAVATAWDTQRDEVRRFLHALPVTRLWGVGRVTEQTLATLSLRTIGDVARAGESVLALKLGADSARHLAELADGVDDRDVVPDRAPVSIGHEDTFERDLHDRQALVRHLLDQSDRVCARLRDHRLRGRTVTLKVKYADHHRVSRRVTLERATSDSRVVGPEAVRLSAAVPDIERRGVRLTGVSLSAFEARDGARQLSLYGEPKHERGEALGDALDKIAGKFGRGALKRAILLDDD